MINVAMISGWHVHAKGYAREINENENARVCAVWDEDEARGKAWAEELGCTFYKRFDDVVKDPAIDAVAVVSPTNLHAKLLLKAAKAGKHIFTEKVLTLKNEDAEKVAKAVKENRIRFVISFPHKCSDALNYVKQLADTGKLLRILNEEADPVLSEPDLFKIPQREGNPVLQKPASAAGAGAVDAVE